MAVKRGSRRRALAGGLDAAATFFGAYKPREQPSIATRAPGPSSICPMWNLRSKFVRPLTDLRCKPGDKETHT